MLYTGTARFMRRSLIFTFAYAVLLLSGATVYSQTSANRFQSPWRGYDTGTNGSGFGPGSFAIGDLDADGDLDILVGNTFFGSPGISILKKNGDGSFAAPVYYSLPIGHSVGEVALSDFDFDGDLDAFAGIRGTNDEFLKVDVWRNNGTGTFASPIEFPTGQAPAGIVIADFTGDNKPDVVTANYRASSISLLEHNGMSGASAGFLAPVHFNTGNVPEKIAAADVNGDGKLDVAVAGSIGQAFETSVAVLINNGPSSFGAPTSYNSPPEARFGSKAVALADLDNDGDVDLMSGGLYPVGSSDYGAVTIRRNNGSGSFGPVETIRYDNFLSQPKEITTADINGDGFPDILAAVPSGRTNDGFVAIRSNGSGGFSTPAYYEASQQTFDVAVFDHDGDGDRDVLTLANSSAAVTVHENTGSGQFRVLPRYEVASLSDAVESADIDNDGDIDVVVNGEYDVASTAPLLKILKNNGNGTFAPATDYTPTRNFADMKLRDMNGDGFVDLVFGPDAGYPSYHFGTALNLGNGTFAPTVVTNVFSCGEGTIDAVDLDGDGDRDVVLTEEQGCIGGNPNRIFIFRNDGNQVFTRMTDIVVAGIPHGLALVDATGDGRTDIITAQSQGIGVYPGNGNLTFGAVIITTIQPYKFRVADFNRDGKIDLGMIMPQPSFGTDTIATSLGNGNGTFQPIRTQTGSSVFESLRISDDLDVRDMNADAIPDIVTFNYASNDISLFVGNADGSLQPHRRYGIGSTPQHGTLDDFDGDGRIDIAAAIGLRPSGLRNALVVLRNIDPASGRKAVFDFDGDGKTDIGIFRPSGGSWWINRSSTGTTSALQFGASTDLIAPADYTGDGKTDIAFFRPGSGEWYVLRSEDNSFFAVPFGTNGDIAAPADYDADGKADFAVFRPSSATWFISRSGGAGTRILQFGVNGDQPVVSDYDGDGKADVAIFRPAAGEWWIDRSTAGVLAMQFGVGTDKTVQGDYTGDGKADVAVWRPSSGEWFIVRSEDFSFYGFPFGTSGDVPASGDYDGDSRFDPTVFRPSAATWFIGRTTAGTQIVQFGANGDKPVANAFVR